MVCSSQVPHSTFGHPEPAKQPRDTSTAMTLMNPFLIFVLHCHLNARLPTTKRVGRQVHTVVPVDESPQSGHGHSGGRQSHGVCPLAGIRCLRISSGRLTAGRDHTLLGALMNTSLRLVIHPG